MKTFTLLFLSAALAGQALAEPPKKRPVTAYAGLWTNSPFTSKPIVPTGPTEVNPLEDYALGGVSPIPGGYRVTLLNRKKPDERIVLPDSSEFKIISVQHSAGDPFGTTVRLSAGAKQGNVAFDKTLLTLKAAPVAQPQPQPNQNPGVPGNPLPNNPNNPQPNGGAPPPRPRVVPNSPGGPGAPQANVAPTPVQQPQRPQIQRPGNSNTPQRPTRR